MNKIISFYVIFSISFVFFSCGTTSYTSSADNETKNYQQINVSSNDWNGESSTIIQNPDSLSGILQDE